MNVHAQSKINGYGCFTQPFLNIQVAIWQIIYCYLSRDGCVKRARGHLLPYFCVLSASKFNTKYNSLYVCELG